MLRVGLTGGLGSGKSTVAAMLRAHGAHILSSDEIGRELMQPGHAVYDQIVRTFGPSIVGPDGLLDRPALARLAFDPISGPSRLDELNAIVHPAVLAEQERRIAAIAAADPTAVIVVESALLFETPHAGPGGWRDRFDQIVLVTAPEDMRIDRFVQRALNQQPSPHPSPHPPSADHPPPEILSALRDDARRRIARQQPDTVKRAASDDILENTGSLNQLQSAVDQLWHRLQAAATCTPAPSVPPAGQ